MLIHRGEILRDTCAEFITCTRWKEQRADGVVSLLCQCCHGVLWVGYYGEATGEIG